MIVLTTAAVATVVLVTADQAAVDPEVTAVAIALILVVVSQRKVGGTEPTVVTAAAVFAVAVSVAALVVSYQASLTAVLKLEQNTTAQYWNC